MPKTCVPHAELKVCITPNNQKGVQLPELDFELIKVDIYFLSLILLNWFICIRPQSRFLCMQNDIRYPDDRPDVGVSTAMNKQSLIDRPSSTRKEIRAHGLASSRS
jgi:hypothetical protein